jgi:hypothetical protein
MTEFITAAVAAAGALVTGVLVALWQVGGRAALARRTIKQELDIAAGLPSGPEKRRLEQLALDRAGGTSRRPAR